MVSNLYFFKFNLYRYDTAPTMNGKGIAITLNAYARLPWAAADYLSPFARERLEVGPRYKFNPPVESSG